MVRKLGILLLLLGGCGEPQVDATCGSPDQYSALAELRAWPAECRVLKVHCDFRGLTGLSQANFRLHAQAVLKNGSSVSALKLEWTDNKELANIHLTCNSLGYTRGGPFGRGEYPPGSCGEDAECWLNVNQRHTVESFKDAVAHELGHNLGLTHAADWRDVMHYKLIPGRNINGKYGPYFSGPEMVKRYGPKL